jgi:hypothetical protein
MPWNGARKSPILSADADERWRGEDVAGVSGCPGTVSFMSTVSESGASGLCSTG